MIALSRFLLKFGSLRSSFRSVCCALRTLKQTQSEKGRVQITRIQEMNVSSSPHRPLSPLLSAISGEQLR